MKPFRQLSRLLTLLAVATMVAFRFEAAHAQEASDADRAANLFAQGKAAAAKRDWPNAHRFYRESYLIRASYDTAANVGHSALKLERAAEAGPYLTYALDHFPATGDANKRAELARMLETVKQKTTTVTVTVDPKNYDLRLDGQQLEGPSGPLFLEPGDHTIELSAPGYESKQQAIVATAGAHQDLQIVLKPSGVSAAPTAAVPDGSSGQLTPAPAPPPLASEPSRVSAAEPGRNIVPAVLIGGGVALAALGTGIGFTLAANSTQDEAERLDRAFPNDSTCAAGDANDSRCKELSDAWDSFDRQRNISYVAFGIAGAAAVATTVYVLLPSFHSRSTQKSGRVRPMVASGPKHLGLSVAGSF